MKYIPLLLVALALTSGCGDSDRSARAASPGQEGGRSGDLTALSDEFDNPATLDRWRHVYKDEGWNANQLEKFDIGKTRAGWMMMLPYASSWYRDLRGVLAYKPVEGDFVMTTRLKVSGRNGSGPPRSPFSLAGIMIRAPRSDSSRNWRPGQENYVFLSIGAADRPGTFQFEVKTTTNSDSNLRTSPTSSGEAIIQVARIGNAFILLKNDGSGWTVHQRYWRPDFPGQVQAGLTCYTDWPTVSRMTAQQHNSTVLRNGNPDLLALYDYVRYRRPRVPAELAGKPLADPRAVTDAQLLRFLGDAAIN